jgi:dolichol-phosphate mannosyltransferase
MDAICIIIPTYNESENLSLLINTIEEVLKGKKFKIIIVDDKSTDGTALKAKRLNEIYGNIVVYERQKKEGIGSAIRKGMEIALSFKDTKHIVTMDGDMQHNPTEVSRLVEEASNVDLVVGSRYVKGAEIAGWNGLRRVASIIANILCWLLFRTRLHDQTTNFRVYSRRCAEAMIKNSSNSGFEWQVSSILAARKNHFKIKEVPISFTKRLNGKTKLSFLDVIKWCVSVARLTLETYSI